MTDWFRSWHGAPFDPKLALVARKAGVPRAVAVAIWWCLLDHASQADDRGSVAGADPEELAVAMDCDPEQVEAVLSAMTARRMIAELRLAAWEKRQPKREDETAAERKRNQRDREIVTERDKPTVTNGHAASRDVTRRHTASRPEQSRADSEQSRAEPAPPIVPPSHSLRDADAVGLACLRLLGWTDDGSKSYGIVHQWLAQGADPERHIYPALRAAVTDGKGKSARSLKYFSGAVTDAMQAAPVPNGKADHPGPGLDAMEAAAQRWDLVRDPKAKETLLELTALRKAGKWDEADARGRRYLGTA